MVVYDGGAIVLAMPVRLNEGQYIQQKQSVSATQLGQPLARKGALPQYGHAPLVKKIEMP